MRAQPPRTAKLLGATAAGDSIVVVTDDDERLEIVVDARLREVVRRSTPPKKTDQAGQGQLEIQMESALRPREMQARIRAGQSIDDVARAAGVPIERIEPYAAPVLAEREHVAGLAQRSTVRRRGETSGHRKLQVALTERLGARGVDTTSIRWDSARTDDGRWAVTAAYESGESEREAMFLFDVSGRFSVAGNDDARWVLGESSAAKGPQPGRRPATPGEPEDYVLATEPTLDLSDELALVRATQQDAAVPAGMPADPPASTPTLDPEHDAGSERAAVPVPEPEPEPDPEPEPAPTPVPDEPTDASPAVPSTSQLDTFYEMLDGYTEDSVIVYRGLDDPTELSETPPETAAGWEPKIVVKNPVGATAPDAGPDDDPSDDSSDEEQRETSPFPVAPDEAPEIDPAKVPDTTGVPETPAKEDAVPHVAGEPDPASTDLFGAPEPKKPVPKKKKRASVPSWDEIMFGGPKSSEK